ncbi:MAG TPA: alpha/beta fold hydrolase [Actinomycetota bacterium]|nr:alpha/beta fold hydrolase [Actinomycetota bacterium]
MPLIDGPDCRLNVEVRGEGAPVTIFAHGITSCIAEIEPYAAATPGTRVMMDLRGHGHSDRPPPEAGYGPDAMRRDIAWVADRFGATRAFGVSVSADILSAILADDPDRFERIVLFLPGALDERNEGAAHFPDFAADLEAMTLEDYATKALADPVYGLLFAKRPTWRALVRQRILRMNRDGVPRALRAYRDAPPPVPEPERLRAVSGPALILAHEDDPVHDAAVARRLAAFLPNATLRVWDEPLAMLDDMPAFARLVAGFLGA